MGGSFGTNPGDNGVVGTTNSATNAGVNGSNLNSDNRKSGGRLMTRAFAIFLLVLVAAPSSGLSQSPPLAPSKGRPALSLEEARLRENWRQLMSRTPTPKAGCYTSAFPSTEWREVPCSTEPARPHPRLVPEDLGGGSNSLSALVTGSLTSATGSLLQVTGVTQESDPGGQNSYSLQLNTNPFNFGAALCAGQAGCFEWQQFVHENQANTPPCVPPFAGGVRQDIYTVLASLSYKPLSGQTGQFRLSLAIFSPVPPGKPPVASSTANKPL